MMMNDFHVRIRNNYNGGIKRTSFFGNVGIGTTNPGTALEIYGEGKDFTFKYDTGLTRQSAANRDSYYSAKENSIKRVGDRNLLDNSPFTPDTTHEILFGFSDTYTQWQTNDEYYPSYNEMRFKLWTPTNSTTGSLNDIMTLRSNGNVGIGITNPLSPLHIRGDNCRLNIADSSENDCDTNAFNCGIAFVDNTYDGTLTYSGNPAAGMGFYIGHLSSSNKEINIKNLTGELSIATRNSDRAIYINNDGNVGIGTATPYARLQVYGGAGAVGSGSRAYFRWGYSSIANNTGTWGTMGIYASYAIVCGSHIVSHAGAISASDTRIKKNITDADDAECLEVLRLLKPKKYQYKDEIERGTEPVWGFIAQEVRETLPYATQLRQDVLPNIYELANVSASNVITFTNFNTSNLESNATTLIRTKGIDGEDHDIHLAEVIDEHTIRVEEDLTEWIGSVDETGNVVAGNQLFIYGQEVDDFVFLKKEAIWTVATSALQEVDRQLQAEKAKVTTLETQLASVLARLDALEGA
jgi:hypothetical protein